MQIVDVFFMIKKKTLFKELKVHINSWYVPSIGFTIARLKEVIDPVELDARDLPFWIWECNLHNPIVHHHLKITRKFIIQWTNC